MGQEGEDVMREIILALGLCAVVAAMYYSKRRKDDKKQITWSPTPRRVDEAMN